MHELANNLQRTEHYIGAYTATQTPANGIDLQGLRNSTFYAYVGAMGGTSPAGTWTFSLQESDSQSSGFTNVSGDDMVLGPECEASVSNGIFAIVGEDGTSPAGPTDDDTIYGVTYKGTKRYVRVVATAANSPGSTVIAVFCLSEPALKPATT